VASAGSTVGAIIAADISAHINTMRAKPAASGVTTQRPAQNSAP